MDWLFWIFVAVVALLIGRAPKHKPLRPVAMLNSADLAMAVRRSERERQASEAA